SDANKNSNNFISECLHRTLGAVELGPPGSREKGAEAVRRLVAECGDSADSLELIDGCGLSRDDRVTARVLVDVLSAMLSDPRAGPGFVASLPICGVDGTLRHRLADVRGRVHAKTGTVNSSRALAGYVFDPADRPAYAFAILINGYHCGEGKVLAAMD